MKQTNVLAMIGVTIMAGIASMVGHALPADTCGKSTAGVWVTGGCTDKSTPELSFSYPWGISVTVPTGRCTDDYLSNHADCGTNGDGGKKCHYFSTTHTIWKHGTGSCVASIQCGTQGSTDQHYDNTENPGTACAG
jgi:hypothetical protein